MPVVYPSPSDNKMCLERLLNVPWGANFSPDESYQTKGITREIQDRVPFLEELKSYVDIEVTIETSLEIILIHSYFYMNKL